MEQERPDQRKPGSSEQNQEWDADQGLELHRLIAHRIPRATRKRAEDEGATDDPHGDDR